MSFSRVIGFGLCAALAACGSSDSAKVMTPAGSTAGSTTTSASGGANYGAQIWNVSGSDSQGAYTGKVELGAAGFTRVVTYAAPVEDNRTLSTVWQGAFTQGATSVQATINLQRYDFVISRGTTQRTAADASPTVVTGAFTRNASGYTGTFAGANVSASETWTPSTDAGPLYTPVTVTFLQTNDAFDAAEQLTVKTTFATFDALPNVQPYVNNPKFQGGAAGYFIDTNDFDFYRANPNSLRVVNKILDPISLIETIARANAYRWPLHQKADYFTTEMRDFVNPPGFIANDIAEPSGTLDPSNDGALWCGVYIATEAYRFWETGDATAKANALQSFDGLLKLQPITGDPTAFARALRPAGVVPITTGWHAGTGAYADVEWLEGGNNDMMKGLMIGFATGYELFCKGQTAYASYCSRLEDDVKNLADSQAVATTNSNPLKAAWLAAVVTGDLNYRVTATTAWVQDTATITEGGGAFQEYGVVDWSGTHLNFWDFEAMWILATEIDLGGAPGTLATGVNNAYSAYGNVRLGSWDIMRAAHGKSANADALADGILRLEEIPCPKITGAAADLSLNPAWVMSPIPNLFWKQDWTTTDRTTGLYGYPLFMNTAWSSTSWTADNRAYAQSVTNTRRNGIDFVSLYWFARHYKVFDATQ